MDGVGGPGLGTPAGLTQPMPLNADGTRAASTRRRGAGEEGPRGLTRPGP